MLKDLPAPGPRPGLPAPGACGRGSGHRPAPGPAAGEARLYGAACQSPRPRHRRQGRRTGLGKGGMAGRFRPAGALRGRRAHREDRIQDPLRRQGRLCPHPGRRLEGRDDRAPGRPPRQRRRGLGGHHSRQLLRSPDGILLRRERGRGQVRPAPVQRRDERQRPGYELGPHLGRRDVHGRRRLDGRDEDPVLPAPLREQARARLGPPGHPAPVPERRILRLAAHPQVLAGLGPHVRGAARHRRDPAAPPDRDRPLHRRQAR